LTSTNRALVQFYYEQFLWDGGVRLRAGKIDPDDYYNLGRWADDYRYFYHTLFSAFPVANHPSGGLGFNAQWYITPEWTLTGGFSDVQGRKTLSGFDTFGDGNFIYAIDATYSPTISGWARATTGSATNTGMRSPRRTALPTRRSISTSTRRSPGMSRPSCGSDGHGRSTGIDLVISGGIGVENVFNRPVMRAGSVSA
jgi:hypothetical protein